MNISFKGTRWFKCDLHLHTPASKCFEDKTVTAEQWVEKAIEKGLNCVAVTDHNTGEWIDSIKFAAQDKNLFVFPGVEITCDTSKVHLLILFDTNKTSSDVNDFIIRCGIDRAKLADQTASTTESIFDISKRAHEHGAIIIPAHIDEFNGLSQISFDNLDKFFELPYINATQIIHKDFLTTDLQINGNNPLKDYLNDYYGNPDPQIDFAKIEEWYKPVKKAISKNIAITTFSDNPHSPKNPKHGIDGIGEKYTWIKMDETPSLEGLRQAFLLPDFRVQNCYISPNMPYTKPDLWFKSVTITNTAITDNANPFRVEFSPQLNTVIGGRGSGKSSILRFIRGVFARNADIEALEDILSDQTDFYKKTDSRTQKGVLTEQSVVEIEFVRNKSLYKIIASGIVNSTNQTITVYKYSNETNSWENETAESFIDFFQFEQYSQKQIYEIAQEPNSLRERIDNSIDGMSELKNDREITKKSFLEKSASIRTMKQQVSGKGKLQTEISDLAEQIKLYQQSGIADILLSKEKFTAQKKILSNFISELKTRETNLENVISSFDLEDIDFTGFQDEYKTEVSVLSNEAINGLNSIKSELEVVKGKIAELQKIFTSETLKTKWKLDFDKNQNDFDTKKQELEQQGINDIANFEKLTNTKESKEKELAAIIAIETNLANEILLRNQLKADYLIKTKEITSQRQAFVNLNMQDEKVQVSVKAFRNRNDFINKLRTIIRKEDSYQTDVDCLTDLCFNGNVERTIDFVRKIFLDIKQEIAVTGITGYFVNLVKGLPDSQIDEIELLLPEDEIEIKYKPTGSTAFKPLSTASAGQKTTAILTFILSQGNVPLILDQPEDDLDNRLVYELVVDRLKQAKEYRQIIVVTHNANIPVNGDAEYILSMDSESKKLKIICSGSVEQSIIKKEICDVMEGSEQAFEMRLKRYRMIK
jgi:PHP family Zn ribbon phosphoesterase